MRVENIGPRSWLLIAVAGWAVLALLLAFAGMGGRVEPLAMGEGLLEPLPAAVPDERQPSLGPLAQYAEIGARPLFSSDRKPKPFSLQGESEEADDSAFDYQLTSVLITPQLRMAILQPADGSESVRVKLDAAPESHPAWRLVELNARSAVFDGPEGRRTLGLRVFDGQGGQAPTQISAQDPGGRNGAPPPPPPPGLPAPPRDPAPPAPSAPAPGSVADAAEPKSDAPAITPEAQMEAIRQRIQARRAALREQAQNRPPPPTPPAPSPSPSPNPPEQSR
ncbi:general secretion pathway protein GspN [Marilutibacter chinensis]|uniref:General secretion pathway protein GspN n=1 Tax=Marilutibacter chinensis TaxID=2912247 RepID=A0ABS9HVB0_9GAMM|nr:general secretion pathway protein GspN [Lysobacter chinensis]MCF7222095.1 general secretion pathway protein GspN [Lysobacter chinensis]